MGKIWEENRKLILSTVIATLAALLVVKFFDTIMGVGVIAAVAVASVLGWNYLAKRHGGAAGVWRAALEEFGFAKEPTEKNCKPGEPPKDSTQ